MSEKDFLKIMNEARKLVRLSKRKMKILYQLVFIETSGSPDSKKAHELIEKMIQQGLITEAQYMKAIDDVERWRRKILDKIFH